MTSFIRTNFFSLSSEMKRSGKNFCSFGKKLIKNRNLLIHNKPPPACRLLNFYPDMATQVNSYMLTNKWVNKLYLEYVDSNFNFKLWKWHTWSVQKGEKTSYFTVSTYAFDLSGNTRIRNSKATLVSCFWKIFAEFLINLIIGSDNWRLVDNGCFVSRLYGPMVVGRVVLRAAFTIGNFALRSVS